MSLHQGLFVVVSKTRLKVLLHNKDLRQIDTDNCVQNHLKREYKVFFYKNENSCFCVSYVCDFDIK